MVDYDPAPAWSKVLTRALPLQLSPSGHYLVALDRFPSASVAGHGISMRAEGGIIEPTSAEFYAAQEE